MHTARVSILQWFYREKSCPDPVYTARVSILQGLYREKSCPGPFVDSKGVNITVVV